MMIKLIKISIFLFFLLMAIFFYQYLGLNQFLSLENLKNHQNEFNEYYNQNSILVILGFTLAYIIAIAFSFPGAGIFTLAAGAIFGLKLGTVIVSIASTIGAIFAFWGARYLFKDFVENKFKNKFEMINGGVKKKGLLIYLA